MFTKKLKDLILRTTFFVIIIIWVLVLIATLLIIIPYVNEKAKDRYYHIINPIVENTKVKLGEFISLGKSITWSISSIVASEYNYYFSSTYFKTLAEGIFSEDYYNQAVAFVMFVDLVKLEGEENWVYDSTWYAGLWYKDYNSQIRSIYFDLDESRYQQMFLQAKSSKEPIVGEPFVFNLSGENKIVQPLIFPIFVGDDFMGMTVLFVSVDFMNEILGYMTKDENLILFAVNSDGVVLNYTANQNLVGSNLDLIFGKYAYSLIEAIRKQRKIEGFYGYNFILGDYVKFLETNIFWFVGLIIPRNIFMSEARKAVVIALLVGISALILFILLGNLVVRKFSDYANAITESVKKLYLGDITEPVRQLTVFEEIRTLTMLLENLRNRLYEITRLHYKLGERSYTHRITPLSVRDELAKSLNYAFEELERRWRVRQEIETSKQQSDWINAGLARIYQAARVQENDHYKLANRVLDVLVDYTGAFIGGIFYFEKSKEVLKPLAVFAYEDPKVINREIKLGEGVVGTVAQERKRTYITKVPEDYDIIVLGLGEVKPKSILIQPLIFEDELLGVIELAYTRYLKDYEIEFVEKAAITISQSIKTININLETIHLLEKFQKQAQELENVRKLLQENIEQLKKREQQLRENEARMKSILDAINHTLLTAEYTVEGTLINANERLLKTLEYTADEIIGQNVFEIISDEERQELLEIKDRVAKGEHIEKIVKRYTKYGAVKWFYATYTPYYDPSGQITRILFFAFDITDTYTRIKELEKEIEMLKRQLYLVMEVLTQEEKKLVEQTVEAVEREMDKFTEDIEPKEE